ncbi:polyketide synthase [Penicillium malachiteum]|uniref:polyketide synthase n=1 Tax=Penicillium malachiteum TaxID=1324776 RepID=UPI0025486C60|nr:polyketide synthase [Penicillium malachiteum]KAJ5715852.1 polyketide synthase [Penicillium malachiteum]
MENITTTLPELDGIDSNDIAVCGFSLKFPQDATTPEALWDMMLKRHCAMTEFPADRVNIDGFYDERSRPNTMPLKGGHFLKGDLAEFDAGFFSIAPTEAASMDPMQRLLLEASYHALENAGIPMEHVNGSPTAVYCGSFGMDYMLQLVRSAEVPPQYAALGFGLSMLANRISWFFNFRGPSMAVDSACSSSAMALDTACAALKNGNCSMALVAGSNMASAPEPYVWMSNVKFLSPDSRCYSFDERANGYARGEGLAVTVLKRVSDAVRDGNTIRAVIRATACNEDGRTPGITQPNHKAQNELIKRTYEQACLSMEHTRFFEAHGTGTPAGDPREAQAIGMAFMQHRSTDDPIHVGAIKSNVGHLEGASGLAGLIKAVLVLEKGIIPPNANFQKVNPKIDVDYLNISFPQKARPWPTNGLRRASVNSFGYGGANAHIVIDDAYNYLRIRGLNGKHDTVKLPPQLREQSNMMALTPAPTPPRQDEVQRLFVWSASDKDCIGRILEQYSTRNSAIKQLLQKYQQIRQQGDKESIAATDDITNLMANVAYTLDTHRSHLQWRSFALMNTIEDFENISSLMSTPVQVPAHAGSPPRIGFVFSGQGAQWKGMGRELTCYESFRVELGQADAYLRSLGCVWSVVNHILYPESSNNIDNPELSQSLCTILQVALVNLLRQFGVRPAAVVGHSSGEIAAAYASGHIPLKLAWRLAYFRGICSSKLDRDGHLADSGERVSGAMMAVALSEASGEELLSAHSHVVSSVSIACINSPQSITLSGDEAAIDYLQRVLEEEKIFARKLRVRVAYHSRHMDSIAADYLCMINAYADANDTVPFSSDIPMVSSVTGKVISDASVAEASYWASNMASPVQFSQAVSVMCRQGAKDVTKKLDQSHLLVPAVDQLLEIGPHATLKSSLREILDTGSRGQLGYNAVLFRKKSAVDTLLRTLGQLHCVGVNLQFRAINEPSDSLISRKMLTTLPEYPFDHSQRYWHDSRLSRSYKLRSKRPSYFHGTRSIDWNRSDARWNWKMDLSEMPWVEHHVVNGMTLYPATGMLVMALEAGKELCEEEGNMLNGFTFEDVHFKAPINFTASNDGPEAQVSLRKQPTKDLSSASKFSFIIRTFDNEDWSENCQGHMTIHHRGKEEGWLSDHEARQQSNMAKTIVDHANTCNQKISSNQMYEYLKEMGYEYGPIFARCDDQRIHSTLKYATATTSLYHAPDQEHVVHPASLDAILHLAFTALTSGGTSSMATSVPSRIGRLWFSASGLRSLEANHLTCLSKITSVTNNGFLVAGGSVSADNDNNLRVWFEDFELTNITSTPSSLALVPDPKQFCMNVEQRLAVDKLENFQLSEYLHRVHPEHGDLTAFYDDVTLLINHSVQVLLASVDPGAITTDPGKGDWKQRYWQWAIYHVMEGRLGASPAHTESIVTVRDRVKSANKVGRLYAEVTLHLVEFFKGIATPLDLLMQTGLLREYYDELMTYRCMKQATTFVDLLAHQNGGMRILEVGGGTAAATRHLIKALSMNGPPGMTESSNSSGSLRCDQYCFTDVSSTFLEKARDEFSDYESQMAFQTLDIEKDFSEQGVSDGTYDVVVADAVLHITADLENTFRNVRKTMKTGGKLILTEFLQPDGWALGFIFGLFPGWWVGPEADRPLSPLLSAEGWGKILQNCGFSGVDMVFKDFDGPAHQLGCVISTAVDVPSSVPRSLAPPTYHSGTIVKLNASSRQQSLAASLATSLQGMFIEPIEVVDANMLAASTDLTLNERKRLGDFEAPCPDVAWHSMGVGRGGDAAAPEYGLIDGLSRTLRAENYSLHLVSVALDMNRDSSAGHIHHLEQVAQEMVSRKPSEKYEQEYIEVDGCLHTRRLVEARYLKSHMESNILPWKMTSTNVMDATFELSAACPEDNNGIPYLVQMPTPVVDKALSMNVRAISLQYQDQLAARGLCAKGTQLGNFCSGIITDTLFGTCFAQEDRVFAVHKNCFRSITAVQPSSAVKLPDDLSFEDACWAIPPLLTAHHGLLDIGRIRSSDCVLVMDGCSILGQAAVGLLLNEGVAEIWLTADSREDCQWASERFNIPEQHILPTSAVGNAFSSTWSELQPKFDIVFATTSVAKGLGEQTFKGMMRNNGQVVLVSNDASQSAFHFGSSSLHVSFLASDETHVSRESLEYAVSTPILQSLLDARSRVSMFSISQLDNLISFLKQTTSSDTAVVQLGESDTVNLFQVRITRKKMDYIDSNATYIISGGLGGVGRSIARWLADNGARHLVLLSRSGPKTKEAQSLALELQDRGVECEMPACDVTNPSALRALLDNFSATMPPVKGCIQAAMVMEEGIFSELSLSSWKGTLQPKLQGSWNLHAMLPSDMDFFIMLSSVMGTLGTGSLAPYNAGNTYQDALARYRVSQGQRAISFNLGAVPDAGYLVSNAEYATGRRQIHETAKYTPTYIRDIVALLEIFCDPSNKLAMHPSTCHPIVGLRPPSHWGHLEEVSFVLSQPFWKHMHHIPLPAGEAEDVDNSRGTKPGKQAKDVVAKLAAATSVNESTELVSEALAARITALLGVAEGHLDLHRPMHSYGLDSLSAIEVRNWIGKTFSVDVPVFMILGGITFEGAAATIVHQFQSLK